MPFHKVDLNCEQYAGIVNIICKKNATVDYESMFVWIKDKNINQNQDLKFVENCLKFVSIVVRYK